MAKQKKSLLFHFTFNLPVAVELDVEWDEAKKEYDVTSVERLMIQPQLNERDIFESLPQRSLDLMDEEIRREFGDG